MNPFYYSPTDPRGPWIYVPGWPDYEPMTASQQFSYQLNSERALAAGIGVRTEDNGLVKRKAFCSTPYWPLADMAEQDAEIEAWQPAPNTVYWLSVEVEIFEQYIEPPDTIHCNRGGDRKYVRIIPNKEEPKPDNKKARAKIWFDVGHGGNSQIHEAVKNDPIAYFASTEDVLKYDHFYRNGLADRVNQGDIPNRIDDSLAAFTAYLDTLPEDKLNQMVKRINEQFGDVAQLKADQIEPETGEEKSGKEFRPNLRQTPDTDLGLK